MKKKRLLKTIVVLMFAMFFADQVIDKFHWYYTIWWVDMVMHFFGGFWVSLFFLYVFHDRLPKKRHIFAIILSVIAIGLAWEAFEVTLDAIAGDATSWMDASSDMVWDILGGMAAMYYNERNAKHS